MKELYYYLDATPTHSYLKMLYKYPQREFPYAQLRRREPPPRQAGTGVRTARHRPLRRRSLLRRLRRVRQGRARRHSDADHGRTIAARRQPASTSCRSSGFATPGPGAATRDKAGLLQSRRIGTIEAHHRSLGRLRLLLRRRARTALLRQRDERRAACTASATRCGHFKDAFHEYRGSTATATR